MNLFYSESESNEIASRQHAGGYFAPRALPPLATVLVGAALIFAIPRSFQPFQPASEVSESIAPEPAESGLAPLFTPEVQLWGGQILSWAEEWGLDPNLIATVMQIESCGDPQAVSQAGAMGLFQVMPYHFQSEEAPYDPGTNATRGLGYLKKALEARGADVRLALAGYNGGIATSARPEHEWPTETQGYVYWVENIYRDAKAGNSSSETLNEWLGSGGASLCAQAQQRLGAIP